MPAISRFYILEKKLPSLPMSVCTTVKVHLDISLWWFILIIFLHFWSALEIKKLLKFNRKLLKIYKHLSLSYLPSTWGFRSEVVHAIYACQKYSVIFIMRPQKSGCLIDIFHQKLNNLLFNSIYTLCALGFLWVYS